MELKNNNSTNREVKSNTSLLDRDLMESIHGVVNIIIGRNDTKKAFDLLKLLEKVLGMRIEEMERAKEIKEFYEKILIKLKFIRLPLLDDADIIELVKNNFTWQFRIPDYDLLDKFKAKLISIWLIEDRDNFKNRIKGVLLGNREVITSKAKIKTIENWLRDYNSKLGIKVADKLKRIQHMVDITKDKSLNKHDLEKLKVLLDFYESLKISSLTPYGFDEEPPVIVKGKLYIFRKGNLELVGKKISKIKAVEKLELPKGGISELQKMFNQYPEGSLERKAVEEEIAKLEAGGGGKKVGQ